MTVASSMAKLAKPKTVRLSPSIFKPPNIQNHLHPQFTMNADGSQCVFSGMCYFILYCSVLQIKKYKSVDIHTCVHDPHKTYACNSRTIRTDLLNCFNDIDSLQNSHNLSRYFVVVWLLYLAIFLSALVHACASLQFVLLSSILPLLHLGVA